MNGNPRKGKRKETYNIVREKKRKREKEESTEK